MRRVSMATAALVAAVVLFLLATLPPQPRTFAVHGDPALAARTVRGAYHVHTTRSDGAEDKDAVAAAAARAGLQFIILTDHGDATRPPDPPAYLHGVLTIDAVEISTNQGHYVALGLPPAPYPLGGDAAAVVEDVERLGGFGIAAHPFHPKEDLSWTEWELPLDGIEWFNADVEWRNESAPKLARVLFDYLLRPAAAVAGVFDRPTRAMAQWDTLASSRHVVGLAGTDAHGSRMGGLEEGKRTFAPGPGYETSFRSLSNRLILKEPLSGDAARDASTVLAAIRAGLAYVVIDGIADGILIGMSDAGISVASPLPPGAEVRTMRSDARSRLEIDLPGAPGDPPMPWVVTNWSGPVHGAAPVPRIHPAMAPIQVATEWRVEKDPASTATLTDAKGVITLRYALAGGERANQFAGAVIDLSEEAAPGRITFRGHAAQPMRVSVQLRFAPDDARWVKSVYLDETEREITLESSTFRGADHPDQAVPSGRPRSLLFVVDLVNALPGSEGAFTVTDVRADR